MAAFSLAITGKASEEIQGLFFVVIARKAKPDKAIHS
jgi:hypothetical protein